MNCLALLGGDPYFIKAYDAFEDALSGRLFAGFSSDGPDCSLLDPIEYHKLLFVPLLSVYLIALPSSAEDLLLERTIKRDNHRKPIIPSIATIGHG